MGAERVDEVVTLLRDNKLDGKVDLVAISSGSSDAIESLMSDCDINAKVAAQLNLRVYSDPTLIAYKHFETVNGIFNTLFFSKEKFLKNIQGLLLFPYYMCVRGRIPFVNAGHPFQQGAIFILSSKTGKPIFSNIEQRPGFPQLNHKSFLSSLTRELEQKDDPQQQIQPEKVIKEVYKVEQKQELLNKNKTMTSEEIRQQLFVQRKTFARRRAASLHKI